MNSPASWGSSSGVSLAGLRARAVRTVFRFIKRRFILSNEIPEGIVNPPVDDLLTHVDSKYRLVLFGAKRARQINAYYSQLGEGLLENVGPLVETAIGEKPLSIALREVQAGVLEYHDVDAVAEASAQAEVATEPDFDFTDPFGDLDPA